MKVVARYSLVLGCTLAIVLAAFGMIRVRHERHELESDIRRDHTTILRVLQTTVGELWTDADPARAAVETRALLARSNTEVEGTRFEWHPELRTPAEVQQVIDDELVSTFPVTVHGRQVGSIVALESLAALEAQLRSHVLLDIAGIIAIVALCLIASRVIGNWLVGRFVEKLVAEATQKVRHADRLATVGKLAAGIAHELGTPLSIVGGHAQMIAGQEVTGEAALASARAIDAEATRMNKIVRQLLDFARRKGPEGTSCDPNEIAHRCASLLAPMAERAHVRCEIHDVEPVARALIDEDSLQQVVTNLAVNAIQAMPEGGALDIAVSRADQHIQIDVSDSGSGIPPDVEAHLFEPFVTTKAPGEGTGLGLAVVHGIVVDHHGWITVATGATGTTFSVHLQEAP